MRLGNRILILISASLAVSCGKEIPAGVAQGGDGNKIVNIAATLGGQSKACVSQCGISSWQNGDAIAAYTNKAAIKKLNLTSISDGIATFSGAFAPDEFPETIAVFPADAFMSKAGSTVTIKYPSTYAYAENALTAPMVAEFDGGVLSLRNVGGIVSVPCEDVPESATQFFIAAVGQKITGNFESAISGDMIVKTTSISGNSKVSVNFENDGKSKIFNIPVPVGTYVSIYAAFADVAGNKISEWEVLKNETVGRADMLIRPRPSNMFRVASYNIRFSKDEDNLDDSCKWSARKDVVPSALASRYIEFMGTQENTFGQISDILAGWKGFSYCGKSNWGNPYDPTNYNEEVAAIYYPSTATLLEKGTFWYSNTPSVPSRTSDDYNMRCCNWAKFSMKGKAFYIFNTHLQVDTNADDKYRAKRVEEAAAVLTEIKKVSGSYPVILTGDFNTTLATANDAVEYLVNEGTLRDARALVSDPHGSYGSLHYFSPENPCTKRVDYVLVNDKVNVHSFWIDNSQQKTLKWESDHHPIVVDISFE